MTTKQVQKIEKIANQSLSYARKAIEKSNEMQALLSVMEYVAGKKNVYKSVGEIFRKIK